jgi:hypothetical protein
MHNHTVHMVSPKTQKPSKSLTVESGRTVMASSKSLTAKFPIRALIYIIFVWLFSLIVSFAPFIGWRDMLQRLSVYHPSINRYKCELFSTEGYVVYSAMGSFVIPIFLMTFLYVRIFIVLKQRTRVLKPRKKKHCFFCRVVGFS